MHALPAANACGARDGPGSIAFARGLRYRFILKQDAVDAAGKR
jgi:hypothetical protein